MNDLLNSLKGFVGAYTNWSRWVGTVIIADILFVWTKTCLDKKEVVDMGLTVSTVLIVAFVVNALRSTTPAPKAEPPTA